MNLQLLKKRIDALAAKRALAKAQPEMVLRLPRNGRNPELQHDSRTLAFYDVPEPDVPEPDVQPEGEQ